MVAPRRRRRILSEGSDEEVATVLDGGADNPIDLADDDFESAVKSNGNGWKSKPAKRSKPAKASSKSAKSTAASQGSSNGIESITSTPAVTTRTGRKRVKLTAMDLDNGSAENSILKYTSPKKPAAADDADADDDILITHSTTSPTKPKQSKANGKKSLLISPSKQATLQYASDNTSRFDTSIHEWSEADDDDEVIVSGVTSTNVELQQQWIDKHQPKQLSDLCMHTKKLSDIKQFVVDNITKLNNARVNSSGQNTNYKPLPQHYLPMLILHGPAGSAKSAALQLIAHSLGCELLVWNEAASTADTGGSYEDSGRRHHPSAGERIDYTPKLQAFHTFLQTAGRYASLSMTSSSESFSDATQQTGVTLAATAELAELSPAARKIVLVDGELPYSDRAELKQQFVQCIQTYLSDPHYLLVFIVTTAHNSSSNDPNAKTFNELESVFTSSLLEDPRVGVISTNPISNTGMKKALKRILDAEELDVSSGLLDQIIAQSNGDVRNAIHALQLYCVPQQRQADQNSIKAKRHTKMRKPASKAKPSSNSDDQLPIDQFAAIGFRDETLSVFHSIGKIIYAKPNVNVEDIVDQSGMEAASLMDWLYANYMQLLPDSSVDTGLLLTACSLSDADHILHGSRQRFGNSTSAVSESAAAVVACRAIVTGRRMSATDQDIAQPSRWGSSGFHAMRGPVQGKMLRLAAQKSDAAYKMFAFDAIAKLSEGGSAGGLLTRSEILQTHVPMLALLSRLQMQPPMAAYAKYRSASATYVEADQRAILKDLTSYSTYNEPSRSAATLNDTSRNNLGRTISVVPVPANQPAPTEASVLADDDITEFD